MFRSTSTTVARRPTARRSFLALLGLAALSVPASQQLPLLVEYLGGWPQNPSIPRGTLFAEIDRLLDSKADGMALSRAEALLEPIAFGGPPGGRARALRELGRVAERRGHLIGAVSHYESAQFVAEQADIQSLQVLVLNDQGRAMRARGDLESARQKYLEALALAEPAGFASSAATALNNLGRVAYDEGKPEAALDYYRSALAAWEQLGEERYMATALGNIASCFSLTGQLAEALEALDRALEIQQRLGDQMGAAGSWAQIGWVLHLNGQPREALTNLNRALGAYRQAGHQLRAAGVLDRIGSVHRASGWPQQAREQYLEALEMFRQSGSALYSTHTRINLCEVSLSLDQLDVAWTYCDRAEKDLRGVEEPNLRAHLEMLKGIYWERSQRPARARRAFENSLDQLDSQWAQARSPALRRAFMASRRQYFETFIHFLARNSSQDTRTRYANLREAFLLTERSRARDLLGAIVMLSSPGSGFGEPSLRQREQTLRSEIAALAPLALADTDTRDHTRQLQELLRDHDTVLADLHLGTVASRALQLAASVNLEEIQQNLLTPDTVLLTYFVGTAASTLWWISTTEIEAFKLPTRNRLAPLVEAVADLISRSGASANSPQANLALRQLSQQLLGPVSDRLRDQRLVIIPDSTLHRVPFAALPHPQASSLPLGEPLLQRHEVVYLPSVAVLMALRDLPSSRHRRVSLDLAIFADPTFVRSQSRVSSTATGQSVEPHMTRPASQPDEPFGDSLPLSFEQLPGSRREALQIANLAEALRVEVYTGPRATRDAALEALGHARILHFATHALLDPRYPQLSSIALSQIDAHGQPESGLLLAQDLTRAQVAADLVVLSACKTSDGSLVEGEGLIGLSRALMAAGGKRVIGSQWEIEDEPTADLMTELYTRMLQDGLPPSQALRRAQMSLLESRHRKSPYYWAAFAFHGDWN